MNHLFKKTMILTFSILFICFFSLSAGQGPDAVRQAAENGIHQFVKNQNRPGLSTPLSQMDIKIHLGFQVFSATPSALAETKNMTDAILPTPMWRFLVTNQGQPFSLITVAEMDGQWQAVSIGGGQLAAEMSAVVDQWPAESGYNLRFVRIYQARSDFMEISKDNSVLGYVPLVSARASMGYGSELKPTFLLTGAEIIQPLRTLVKENLQKTARATEK